MLRTSSRSNLDCGHNFVQRCFIAVFQQIGCPHVEVPCLRHQQSWYFYIISGIQYNGIGNLFSNQPSGIWIWFPTSPQESEFCMWKSWFPWVRNIKIPGFLFWTRSFDGRTKRGFYCISVALRTVANVCAAEQRHDRSSRTCTWY